MTAHAPAEGWRQLTPPAGFRYVVICDQCGVEHVAEYSHDGQFSEGPLFAVVCTADWLTDYYTGERLIERPTP